MGLDEEIELQEVDNNKKSTESSIKEEKKDLIVVSQMGRIRFVENNGKYGVTDNRGNEIIPCEFIEYSDAYHEWEDLGCPEAPVPMTRERLVAQQFKNGLKRKREDLLASGDIGSISFFKERTIIGSVLVKLSDGSIGIAATLLTNMDENDKKIEIKNAAGEHVKFLSEPELLQTGGLPVICSDEDFLYVGAYNTKFSFVACYKMGDFERVWKTPMHGSQIQSMTVNDNEVIVFDMGDGKIKYFDKQSGKRNENKEISTDKVGFRSHHNLASTNERLLAGSPAISLGLFNFKNELKVFDNASGETIAQKSVSKFKGTLNSLTVDRNNNRVFIAFDKNIAVFDENGYLGYFLAPTGNIQNLNFDQETGSLMISMHEGKSKVEVYNPDAITTLLQTSRELKTELEAKLIETSSELVESSQVIQEQFNNNQESSKHMR